ncbi:MAG: hypothetical protein PVF84_04990 [Desulfuromonadales bacterium]|jgi:predicted RNA-binding Zn-ribbon protein involved in translation (DUF1610 family)
MKKILSQYRLSWFVSFCLAGILAIVVCNISLLYFGHCVVNDFLAIPPIGWFIIGANLVAAAVLALIKQGTGHRSETNLCANCNVGLRDAWVYCPNCGTDATCRSSVGVAHSGRQKVA